jgi:small nuclear ribonucleoprotein (snRNP)-like protein
MQGQQQHQQQQQQQRRSKTRSSSSLVALLFALTGRKLTLELRNDVMVSGSLADVDEYMNMYLDDAVWTPVEGPAQVGRWWGALSQPGDRCQAQYGSVPACSDVPVC